MKLLLLFYFFLYCYKAIECQESQYEIFDEDTSEILPGANKNANEFRAPIIGILSQEISSVFENAYPGQYRSMIAASYVKFIEGGGARVIPIWIDKPKEYYTDIMSKINGILLPGGAAWFYNKNGYSDAGMHIFQHAKELFDAGGYFPIWGTCLGFELLSFVDADRYEHRDNCSSQNQGLPLVFENDFKESKLFRNASEEVINSFRFNPITSNFHKYCTTEMGLTKAGIAENWKTISTNRDWDGFKFISTMEHTKYPFYGVQFHPEKNIYEWVEGRNISHTVEAIHANQYFSEFFVNEARKNHHTFLGGLSEEQRHLIYNYPTSYTRLKKIVYEQTYLFAKGTDYIKEE